MSWNEEKVAKLKELWGKGNTASQIAEIIGGLSRNAVIGKAHRLNLSSKIRIKNSEVSYVVIGQELSAMEKMSLGELDGKRYAKRAGGNVILGFFTGLIGSGIVYLTSNQTPSFEAMAGPNKAIVNDAMYVNGYIKGAKNKSTQNALIGTIGWVVLLLL